MARVILRQFRLEVYLTSRARCPWRVSRRESGTSRRKGHATHAVSMAPAPTVWKRGGCSVSRNAWR